MLGVELLGLVAAAEYAERVSTCGAQEAASAAQTTLLGKESGTHADAVCAALASLTDRPGSEFSVVYGAAVRTYGIDPIAPVGEVAAQLGERGIDLDQATGAVVRFESCKYIGLAWKISHRLADDYGRDVREFIGEGWRGLTLSLRKYDPSRYEFSTYAAYRIAGTIRDSIRDESPVPKRLMTLKRKTAKIEEDLTTRLARWPTIGETARSLGDHAKYLQLLPRLSPQASLEEIKDNGPHGDGWPTELVTPLQQDVSEVALESLRQQAIYAALAGLPEEEQKAVRLLYLDELTSPEAQHRSGVPARLIRTRAARGLDKLRRTPEIAGWR